jgi:hypothetical protein
MFNLWYCSQLRALKKDLAEVEAHLARTARLLKIADPDGWLNPKSKAASAAKVSVAKQMEAEKRRKTLVLAKKQAEQQVCIHCDRRLAVIMLISWQHELMAESHDHDIVSVYQGAAY